MSPILPDWQRFCLRLRQAFFFARDIDDSRSAYFLGGLWIFLCPPVGWYLALGFRTQVGYRLLDGITPALPSWRDWPRYLSNGLKAGAVIQTFYLPYMAAFWLLAFAHHPVEVFHHPHLLVLFIIAVIGLPPAGISLLPALYSFYFPWFAQPIWQSAILAILFFAPTLMLPSAFMQVLQARSFRAAFRLKVVLSFIVQHRGEYLEAWAVSLVSIALAASLLVFSPWGFFWTYPAITYAFQSIFQPSLLKQAVQSEAVGDQQ